MTPLRKQTIDYMSSKNFSKKDIDFYINCIADLAKFYNKSPEKYHMMKFKSIYYICLIKIICQRQIIIMLTRLFNFFTMTILRGDA